MVYTTLIQIVNRINKVAATNGVCAEAYTVRALDRLNTVCWDIEIIYDNYHIIERFNSSFVIHEDDVDDVAAGLLSSLFNDYFAAKLSHG